MKIDVLEDFMMGGAKYSVGEKNREIADNHGAIAVTSGWATDLSGAIQTGTRVPGTATVQLENVTQGLNQQ